MENATIKLIFFYKIDFIIFFRQKVLFLVKE